MITAEYLSFWGENEKEFHIWIVCLGNIIDSDDGLGSLHKYG